MPGFEQTRYVLIQTLPDGTPKAVKPVTSLEDGEREMVELIGRGEYGWHLFDVRENRRLWPLDGNRSAKT
jgi:hypothetical protein